MALFHQPVSKIQLAKTLGMSESTLRREITRKNIEIEHHCRLSPKEAEELVIKLGYDPIDEVLFQRAKKVQDDYPLGK